MIARQLGVSDTAAILEQAGLLVSRDRAGAENLGQPSLARSPPHLHLPKAILRRNVSLREEQVLGGLSVDVRHTPRVANHAHGCFEACGSERTVDLREC